MDPLILKPIAPTMSANAAFADDPDCSDTLQHIVDFYGRVGFQEPWICYYATRNGAVLGSCGFKGAPKDGTVEIAYGTVERFRKQGVAGEMCRLLVNMSLTADPSVRITARTLPERNHSVRILEKNGFSFSGTVTDPEDGDVWEWVHRTSHSTHQ